jgi:putative peptidoglycan lipid II flippase
MFALAAPTVDLIFRGGSFNRTDSATTAAYFGIFTISLALWSAQAIYSRAFFAAGETLAPMRAGTIITVISIPIYWGLHHQFGVVGLAWASNLAILAHTVTLAILAHRRRLISLRGLDLPEISRSIVASLTSLGAVLLVLRILPHHHQNYLTDAITLIIGGLAWLGVCVLTLRLTGSKLPQQLLRQRPNA